MTTDITELAQSLKAAAINAKELAIIARYSKGRAAAEKFYALANPNNVIALVEALEKAQAQSSKWLEAYHKAVSIGARYEERIAELESRTVKIPGWFVKDAIAVYDRDEIEEALSAAGIKWEAE
ncbi:hypothetical protein [Raoultella ornithinolytica]|uniref:hypothetical protein n=1 Tax=Raoultella ornithinolytica TaxID=54291 RepID=UPI003982E0AF